MALARSVEERRRPPPARPHAPGPLSTKSITRKRYVERQGPGSDGHDGTRGRGNHGSRFPGPVCWSRTSMTWQRLTLPADTPVPLSPDHPERDAQKDKLHPSARCTDIQADIGISDLCDTEPPICGSDLSNLVELSMVGGPANSSNQIGFAKSATEVAVSEVI